MSNKKFRIIPLGGLGEVGKNMMAYAYGIEVLVVSDTKTGFNPLDVEQMVRMLGGK